MTTNNVIVETRRLTKVYRDFWGRQKKVALRALNLTINRGEIFGLLGPNGSGKTTTIKLLLGLLFPTEGDALVFNTPAAEVKKNERIGYLPEESYLYRFLNADKKRSLREYSKGMRQRIGFAQALINDPELVILDEPTSGLDPAGTRWMKDKIVELRNRGKTILMCTHRLEDVQDICDRIAILNLGELRQLGSVKELLEDVQRVEMRASGVQISDGLKRDLETLLAKYKGKLEFLGHPTTTLEDLFLRIVEESEQHPGRRYLPEEDRNALRPPADGLAAKGEEKVKKKV